MPLILYGVPGTSAVLTDYARIINNAAILIFVAEPIQQEVNETAFRDFQHIRCLHLEHTRPNVADVNPTQANAC